MKVRRCLNCTAHGESDGVAKSCKGKGGAKHCTRHPIDDLTQKRKDRKRKR